MRAPTRLAVLIAFALAAASCGDDGGGETVSEDPPPQDSTTSTSVAPTSSTTTTTTTAASAAPGESEDTMVSVAIPDYPWWDNDVVVAAEDRLDALAADYVAEVGDDAEMERFLFGQMPVIVFDEIFGPAPDTDLSELFWLLHLSGYFGGRWLRGEIAAAQPDALLVGFSDPPTEAAFLDTVAAAQDRLELLSGDDAAIITAARDALFDKPPAAEGEEAVQGQADSFGYNVGYMLEILATPPEGVAASPQFEVTCDGLFNCDYASPKLAVLADLADLQAAINSDDPPEPELLAELRPVQDAAEPRGRGVWSGGLSVQGFSQGSYDQLLDVSSSFLETVQATVLTNLGAVIESDPDAAAIGITSEAAQIVWLSAYIAGLTNGEGEIELPEFVVS